jgi:hypothetical protein
MSKAVLLDAAGRYAIPNFTAAIGSEEKLWNKMT